MNKLDKIFSQIYDQNIERIYRFIFLKVNSQELAQDLSSEVFLRIWEKIKQKKGNPINNPRAFLYQTARNLVIDYYRVKDKNQTISSELVSIIDLKQNLEKKAILNSDLETIRTSLAELKENYQNVIIWHYLDDLSISEIAELLGRTEQSTRVLLCRALESLRQKISQSC